jgi:hypothetical protein
MVEESLAAQNLESWEWLSEFYDDLVARPSWQWVTPIKRLVDNMRETEIARNFRAGQSLWHLIISTAEKHGLSEGEPFVVVTLDDDRATIKMEYRRSSEFKVLKQQFCKEEDASKVLQVFLDRLWADTRGET